MRLPLVSVIVPIFNGELFLADCVESILLQTHKNLEIILINDGSTDDSLSLCYSFREKDNRVVVVDQQNQGVSKARNAGIQVAKGEYIGFLDSDDFIDPHMYRILLDKLKKEGSDCAALFNFTVRRPSKQMLDCGSPINGASAVEELCLLRFPTAMWAYLYSAGLVKRIKLSEDVHFFEDFEFNLNFLKRCSLVSLCYDDLYSYRKNPFSTNCQEINEKRLSSLNIYEKHKRSLGDPGISSHENLLFFSAHCVISVIMSYARSRKNRRIEYKRRVKAAVVKSLRDTAFARCVPLSYKAVFFVFTISPDLSSYIIKLAKK